MGKQTTTFYMNERVNCVKSLFIFKMKNNIAFFCAHVIMLFRVHLKNSLRLHHGVFSAISASGKIGTIPHNIAQRLTDAFTPSAACSFLDVPPVRLRNLQFASDANPSRHPSRELCGIAPRFSAAKPSIFLLERTKNPLVLSPLPFSDTP